MHPERARSVRRARGRPARHRLLPQQQPITKLGQPRKYENALTEIGQPLRLIRQLLDQPITQVEWIAIELRIAQ